MDHVDVGRGGLELAVDQPLQPLVEPPAAVPVAPDVGDVGPLRVPGLLRPLVPVGTVLLGQHAERGVVAQGLALPLPPPVERRIASEALPELLQRLHLEAEHRVAVDAAVGVERPPRRGQRVEPVQGGGAVDVLHPQVQRVSEAPAAREVGTGRLGQRRVGGVQRIDEDEAGPQLLGRPAGQPAEVGQIAHAPAGRGPHGVELHRPAPRRRFRRQGAAARGDDDVGVPAVVERGQGVVAEGQGRRQGPLDGDRGTVLGGELGRPVELDVLARAHEKGAPGRRRLLAVGAHRRQHQRHRLRAHLVPAPLGVLPPFLHAPLDCAHVGPESTGPAPGHRRAPWPAGGGDREVEWGSYMSKWLVERKLSESADRLRQVRAELGVVDEQLAFLADAADDARLRAMVSETPMADREHREAQKHADAMGRHRASPGHRDRRAGAGAERAPRPSLRRAEPEA